MNWLKDRKHKITVSLIAGLAAALLAAGMPEQIEKSNSLAWWGVMYPKFCFAQPMEESGQSDSGRSAEQQAGGSLEHMDGSDTGRKVKISFWLAKALDW